MLKSKPMIVGSEPGQLEEGKGGGAARRVGAFQMLRVKRENRGGLGSSGGKGRGHSGGCVEVDSLAAQPMVAMSLRSLCGRGQQKIKRRVADAVLMVRSGRMFVYAA